MSSSSEAKDLPDASQTHVGVPLVVARRGGWAARLPPQTPTPHSQPAFSQPVVPSIVAPHLMRGRYPRWGMGGAAIPTNLPPLTHNRHSPNPSCRTPIRYPRWGMGARLSPLTFHPLPTSGILPTRLPRRRSGTQVGGWVRSSTTHVFTRRVERSDLGGVWVACW